jgi:sarcosine oxidase delta subunit
MTVVCPICKSSPQELLHTGGAAAFHCPAHGDFKVADSVFEEAKAKDYTRDQWEAALDKAEQRAEPDEWPLIIVDDFY